MKKIILIVFSVFCCQYLVQAQTNGSSGNLSPGGSFDKMFDRFGNTYSLEDLLIDKSARKPSGGNVLQENVVVPTYLLCSPGYFNIYFEEGSGFEKNTPLQIARRDVMCQVFTDLSNFITPANPGVKVNIWVRDLSNVYTYPAGSGVLGLATSFYAVPTVSPPVGGILDGQIWETINSGVDAYTNVASPLVTGGGLPGAFYHGMIAFNFIGGTAWHTDLTSATAAAKYDLYTTILHEVTHALGFASLINSSGGSVFGSNYPYYSRYDLNLQTFGSAPLIITTSGCSLYDYEFNPSIFSPAATLAPNPLSNPHVPDHTDCLLALKYAGSVNQAVYTPNFFEQGSSLSHLEDECYDPTPYPNNQYYCMANASGVGSAYMMRYLKPEERGVLCDIGYLVNSTYGNLLYTDNNYNYGGSACPGLDVAGVNDGMMSGGSYTWVTSTSGIVNLTGSDFIGNDYNADAFECLEVINGMGSISVNSGSSATATVFTAGGTPGIALLRYIPVNTGTGNRGNITYAYVYIGNGTCVATACNMIMNEGFEGGSNCGEINPPDNATIDCWEPLIESPDYFVRGCTPSINGDVTIPTGLSICNPATDSWNNGLATNDAFLGLSYTGSSSTEEAEQTILSTPMMPNIPYTISFWAKAANSGPGGFSGENRLSFRGDMGVLAPLPPGSYATTGNYLVETIVPDDGIWHYYTLEFTAYNTMDNLMVANLGNSSGNDAYVFIDDLTLNPTAHTAQFKAPPGLCAGETSIADLSQYVFPAMPPGASFSGLGVSLSGGIYSFTSSGNGLYTIFYNYTSPLGCTVQLPAVINVTSAPNPTVFITSSPVFPPSYCEGWPITLFGNGAKTYAWYGYQNDFAATIPCSGPCSSIIVTPPAPGYWFNVIGTDSLGCRDSNEFYVPALGCGGSGGGNPPVVKTFEMPDDVKHYTTKIVPGTKNYSVMAGTIFRAGANNIHFLLLDHDGGIIISKEYRSAYIDERVVDIQEYTDQYKVTRWYIVCQSRTGGQDIIKVLCVDNVGTLIDQREYVDNMGLNTYPMNAVVWSDGGADLRLFICGYQTMGGPVLDYTTPKQAFVSSIDINWGSTHMNPYPSFAYNWGGGNMDFDIATRMAVIESSNQLWITGSTSGVIPLFMPSNTPPQAPDRSAVMNLVIDPISGGIMSDNTFLRFMGNDDNSGPSDYGVDLIQVDGGNFILGNSAGLDASLASMPFWGDMVPRPSKLWWIQPVDDVFAPAGNRSLLNSIDKHWAAQAIVTGKNSITVATLTEDRFSNCTPVPDIPSTSNIQVTMVPVDLSGGGAASLTPSHVYMTNTGTGAVGSINSFYDLGGPLSLIEYPPKFAALGSTNYAINAPKFMNGKLNLKVLTPDASLSIPCGEFNCNLSFILVPNMNSRRVNPAPSDIAENMAPSPSNELLYIVPGGNTCHDMAGNPSYRYAAPNQAENIPTETKIYPNPATDAITLELAKEVAKDASVRVVLQNVLGQNVDVLYNGITVRKLELQLPSVPQGVYMVQVYANDEVILQEKLIIKK